MAADPTYQPGIYKKQGGNAQVFKDNAYAYWGTDEDISVTFDGTELVHSMIQTAWNSRAMQFEGYPTTTAACCRNGVMSVYCYRDAAYPMTSWDGNADIAFRVYSYNYAANSTSYCRIEGMEVLARNRTGSCVSVTGAYITAENYTGSAGVVDVTGLEIHAKNNAVASGNVKCLRVYDESQSGTGTNYGIEITCTAASAFTREYCIYIDSGAGAGWTNGITFDGTITNVLDFAESDGTNGATYSAGHYATLGSIDGKIKIDVGGNTLYIPGYASIAA